MWFFFLPPHCLNCNVATLSETLYLSVCVREQRGISTCTVYRDESGIETGISWWRGFALRLEIICCSPAWPQPSLVIYAAANWFLSVLTSLSVSLSLSRSLSFPPTQTAQVSFTPSFTFQFSNSTGENWSIKIMNPISSDQVTFLFIK